MQDQYLELSTALQPNATLYGLGEHTSSAGLRVRRDGQPLALWARDCGSAFPDVNLYSSWPYWLEVRPGARPCLSPATFHEDVPAFTAVVWWRCGVSALARWHGHALHACSAPSFALSTNAAGLVAGRAVLCAPHTTRDSPACANP